MHALIIEDEWSIVDAVEDALRQIGFSPFADANSVEEAVAAARRKCPDLIVRDPPPDRRNRHGRRFKGS